MRNTLLIGCLAACLICPAVQAESADLRPKFTADRVTHYRNSIKTKQSMQMGEQAMELDTVMEMGLRMKVLKSRPEGGGEVELTYLYLSMDGGMPQMPMKYDSRKPKDEGANPMISGLGGMVGIPLVLTVSAAGKIEKVDGMDKVSAALGSAGMFGGMVEQLVSEESLKQMPFFATRNAANPAEVGSKWEDKNEIDVEQMGVMLHDTTYTLKGISSGEKTADIAAETTMKMKPPEGGAPAMMQIEEGKSVGRITWDLAAGEVAKAADEADIVMSFSGMGGEGGGGKMKQKINAVSERVSLKDLNLPAETSAPAEKGEKKETPK